MKVHTWHHQPASAAGPVAATAASACLGEVHMQHTKSSCGFSIVHKAQDQGANGSTSGTGIDSDAAADADAVVLGTEVGSAALESPPDAASEELVSAVKVTYSS